MFELEPFTYDACGGYSVRKSSPTISGIHPLLFLFRLTNHSNFQKTDLLSKSYIQIYGKSPIQVKGNRQKTALFLFAWPSK